jgi:hypothetical protein
MAALKDLPALRDTSAQRREPLFQQKLQLCSVIFNFDDPQVSERAGGRAGRGRDGWSCVA